MFDYFYTDEGIILAIYGVEGETFNYIEDQYGIKAIDHTGFWEDSDYDTASTWMQNSVRWPNAWQFLQYDPSLRFVDESDDATLEEVIAEADPVKSSGLVYNAYRELARRQVKSCDDYPSVVYTSEENDQRNKYFTAIQTYIQSTKAELLLALRILMPTGILSFRLWTAWGFRSCLPLSRPPTIVMQSILNKSIKLKRADLRPFGPYMEK